MPATDTPIPLRAHRFTPTRRATAGAALFRRAFLDARTRTVAFAYVFAVYSWLQSSAYRSTYPTQADRIAFARSFAGNDAIRLFYGYPYDVVTVGGYSAWRVGGTLVLAAAAFGVLAAVRAMRTEEDAGRTEIVLAGCVPRRTSYLSAMAAIGAGTLILWFAEFAGFVVGRLPVAGSAYLALATVSVVPVFVGIGAVASQLAPNRRVAIALSSAAAVLFWLLRIVADTWAGGAWLRWATPLGWAEELRPFTGAHPAVLLLPVAACVPLVAIAARINAGRDVGAGILPARDTAAPHLRLLSSPIAQALRSERGSLATWMFGFAAFSVILGKISTSISSAGVSTKIQKDFAKFGTGSIVTPSGYLAFVFIIVILAVCLFVCSQIGAAREEEAEERLETLFALPVGRRRWFGGRLLIAALAAATLSVLAGLLTWAGAASQGVNVSLPRMLEAGANGIPISLLFLGIAALAYAVAPRASAAIAYGLVSATFLWYLVGSVLGIPKWIIDLTPFRHIGLVPVQTFQATAAWVMVAVGVATAAGAVAVLRHRDLFAA
ncbi:MAG: polyketide antibiotic transporter [Acidimicrobiales bacterium]